MNKANPTVLFGFFVAIIVAMCGTALMKGGVYIGKHEGDTFHLLQIVFRMADGQWPHLDFMTPIGGLAFAPIVLFVSFGFGIGKSIILAQGLVAIVLLPAVWWVAYSRMRGLLPYLFGFFVLVLVTALIHGESQRSVSLSMHYNRWAWAAAFLAISVSVLPNKGTERPTVDGIIVGLAMSALMMIKVTYFAAFAVPVILAMVLHKSYRALFIALISGAVVALAITLVAGGNYWLAYLGDLLAVSGSEFRSDPSDSFGAVVGAPAYIAGSLTLMASIILLRQSGASIGGLVLLLLAPGFFFVTYQNFGNDPQWLMLLAVLLLALQPAADVFNGLGWDMRNAVRMTAAVTLALAAPSFLNLAYSPWRHLNTDVSGYAPMLPNAQVHTDLQANIPRSINVDAVIHLDDGPNSPYGAFWDMAKRSEPTVFRGETLPVCQLKLGLTTWFQTIVDDLDNAGLAEGKRLLAADLFSSHWLFGPLLPLKHGAPWHYGGLPGFDSADYVLVPLCPVSHATREQILENVTATGATLTEIRRTPVYILFSKG